MKLTATCKHVAGPTEKEPDSEAGWHWTQRCLRCDALLNFLNADADADARTLGRAMRSAEPGEHVRVQLAAPGGFYRLGQTVYELDNGEMTVEAPGTSAASAAPCVNR